MRFMYPYFFILLTIPGYFIYEYFFRRKYKNYSSFIKYSSLSIVKAAKKKAYLNSSRYFSRANFLFFLKILSMIFFIFALARPQSSNKIQEVLTKGYDILLCLDTSESMRAEDLKPNNRFYVAREVTKEFIKNRPYDRIGLVVFGGIAYTQCPLTSDHDALLSFVDKTQMSMTNVNGTAIGSAIATCVKRMKDLKAKSKIVILITDGSNNAGEIDPLTAAKVAKAFGIKIYAIGVGKKGKALYPINDPVFGKRYVTIPDELDEKALTSIAQISEGKYFRAQDEHGLKKIYKTIDSMEKSEVKIKEYHEYKELYLYFLIPGLILLFLEILLVSLFWIKIP